ncbi:serine hydrolase domain-containing protein [Pseudokineococcus sp. 5B2Z-1]|uniref:serine hydrolase domain-containing protein n=1 Tax=Pseudokineococcus sp. 5B2Z-1 TaxID=3132744 RepID=UPI00309F6172
MRLLLPALALGLVLAVAPPWPSGARTTAISAPQSAEGVARAVEEVVAAELDASGAPGVAWAVVLDGEVGPAGAAGVARLGDDERVTPATPFALGSITKGVTALAVVQLVEAGDVDLDAPASRYVASLAGGPAADVTVRQLLSHTAGFSTRQGSPGRGGAEDDLERRVARLAAAGPARAPGERWEYSNAGYLVLGRLVEEVSGRTYQRYVTEEVLRPLGMDDSFVADGRTHDVMATGHRPWFWTKHPLPEDGTDRAGAPAGGVVASARDVARYLAAMVDGEDDVVSARGEALLTSPAGGASPWYGLGWSVDSDRGTVWHSGSTPGVETLATMVPAEGRAAVVLVNAGSGVGVGETTVLRDRVTAAALGLAEVDAGPRWPRSLLFASLVLLPVGYVLSAAWAWRHRDAIRAKRGPAGVLSIGLPLLTTTAGAWVVLDLVPRLLGTTVATLGLFQPDLALVLVAGAATGVLWAVLRLGIALTGPGRRLPRAPVGRPAAPQTPSRGP